MKGGGDLYGKLLLAAAPLLLLLTPHAVTAGAQDRAAEAERDAVRRAVETYLYAEEVEEKRRVIYPKARIYSVDHTGAGLMETPLSAPAKKAHKGAKVERGRQKVVDIDVGGAAAVAKVETDLAPDAAGGRVHFQFISLLKSGGVWRIVSIAMPPVQTPEAQR